MSVMRRRLAAMAAGSALALPFVRRAAAAVRISIAAPGGIFQQVFQTAVLDPFRRVRPDIGINYFATSNPAQILGMLRMHQASPQFDAVIMSPRTGMAATTANLLDPLRPETMPVLAELVPAALMEGLAGAALMIDSLAIAHVPNATTREITSWRILWDPGAVSRIAIPAPPDPVGIGLTLIAATLFTRGLDRQSLDGAINAIRHVAPRVVSWHPRPDVCEFLIDESASIGPSWNATGQVRAKRNPTRLRMAVPGDAVVRDIHTIHVVRNTPRTETARAFVAYALGTEAQTRIADMLFMTPVNAEVRLLPETARRIVPLADPRAPLSGIDAPEIEAMRGMIVSGWRERILR